MRISIAVLLACCAGTLVSAPARSAPVVEPDGEEIYYSGPLNIVVPEMSVGVDIRWRDAAVCYEDNGCNAWDYDFFVRPWYRWNGTEFATNPVFHIRHADQGLAYADGAVRVLQPGDTVHAGLDWGDGTDDPGGGVFDGSPSAHWWPGRDAYIGFRFRNRQTHRLNYGYLHVVTSAPHGHPVTLVDYAFDTTGAGITIPGPGVPDAPSLSLDFAPATVPAGASSMLSLRLRNRGAQAATLSADFVDVLPEGLIATGAATTCENGAASVGTGGGAVVLAAGARIPAAASCLLTATIRADTAGTHEHTVPAGSLITDQGDYPADAAATLYAFDHPGPFPPLEDFDSVTAPALPSTGWFSTYWLGNSIGDPLLRPSAWVTTDARADSGTLSAYVTDATVMGGGGYETDISLLSPVFTAGRHGTLSFRQSHEFFETVSMHYDDGGALEISIAGGPFEDVLEAGGQYRAGGYTDRINTTFPNPLAGRLAWGSFTDGAWYTTTLGLPPRAEGQPVQLRWRFGTDHVSKSEWWVDTVSVDPGTSAGTHAPRVSAAFVPSTVVPGGSSRLTLTLRNDQNVPGVLTQDFVDELPEGLVASNPGTTCNCAGPDCQITVGDGGELRLVLADQSIYLIPANASCTVSADVTVAAAGSYVDTVPPQALVLGWEHGNREPATARLVVLAPADCLFADGFEVDSAGCGGGTPGVYTDVPSFVTQLAPDYREEFFDTLPTGQQLAWASPAGGVRLSSVGQRDIGLHGWPNLVTTERSWSAIKIDFAPPVTAIGGHFWAAGVDGNATGTEIVVQLGDGTLHTFTSTGPDDFRGFVTEVPIQGISIDAPSSDPEGDVLFAYMSDIIVGARR